MKDDFDPREAGDSDLGKCGRNRADSVTPILAAVAGDEKPPPAALVDRARLPSQSQQGVDSAVAGDVDRPANALAPQIGCTELCRREQELRIGIDRDPELLLGPGMAAVVASKPGLDMRHWDSGDLRGERTTERARRVALDNRQGGPGLNENRDQRLADHPDMGVRVELPGTVEEPRREAVEAVVGRRQISVLAGEEDERLDAARAQRGRYRCDLDRFGTRSDDARNCLVQPSP
jgi:hypothetical protein